MANVAMASEIMVTKIIPFYGLGYILSFHNVLLAILTYLPKIFQGV